MSLYSYLVRPILFSFDSESVHDFSLDLAARVNSRAFQRVVESFYSFDDPVLKTSVAGINFNSPIGLAAGFDKNCKAVPFFGALGFDHIEIGSVTGLPQEGNPKPRIFRLLHDRALVNRMGFPSEGAQAVSARLSKLLTTDCRLPVMGINLGKSKVTPIDDALQDYSRSFELLSAYGDYFVLNVSSPNTPELRKLQERGRLMDLFNGIQSLNTGGKPVLVKVAPDLTLKELDEILEVCDACKVAGIIATNTTFSRDGLIESIDEQGGLSGAPLASRALEVVSYIYRQTKGQLPIIGLGGVSAIEDVVKMLSSGASLVQVYTGFVYKGPGLVKRLKQQLADYCKNNGVKNVSELVGKPLK